MTTIRRHLARQILIPALALLGLTLAATSAQAQERVDWEATAQVNLMTSSTSTSTTSMFAVWAVLDPMFSTTTKITDGISSTTNTALAPFSAAKLYISHNQVALKQDITLGAGQTVEDLARLCGLDPSHDARFGRALRAQRAALLPHLSADEPSDQAILDFLRGVVHAMSHDRELRQLLPPEAQASR